MLEAPTLPYLEPGETATLTASLHLHAAQLNPGPFEVNARLAVTQAYGAPVAVQPIHLTATPPTLRLKAVHLLREQGQQDIAVTLDNPGLALGKAAFRIDLPGLPSPTEVVQDQIAVLGTATLSFGLDPNAKLERGLKIALFGQKLRRDDETGLPLYDWEFKDVPVAFPGLPWSLYAGAVLLMLALGAGLRYQQIYRHPVVLRLTAQPDDIRSLDPGKLATAGIALKRAHRLTAILESSKVHPSWLDAAARFDGVANSDERCRILVDRLQKRCDASEADSAAHYLVSLGDDFPINLQRIRLVLPDGKAAARDIFNALANTPEVTLALGATPEQRGELSRLARERNGMLVAPDGAELTRLLLAEDPISELASLIGHSVPVTQTSPYQTGGGVHRKNLFFGRGAILAQVTGRDPANYLVVGGRQVGKSSLLKELDRRYRHEAKLECHYLALSNSDGLRPIVEALGLRGESSLGDVRSALRKKDRRRAVFLVDEADAFVEEESQQQYATLQALRAWSEEGLAHFILAGFWGLYRQAALDYHSPLKNFGQVVALGALEKEACRSLAVDPMGRMGIGWESENLLNRLIDQTGQRANLISIACDEALYALGPKERLITPQHLEQVLAGNRIRHALGGWGNLGSTAEESQLDRIVVYASARHDRFTLAELLARLEKSGLRADPEALKNSLARLELAFVLGRSGNQYSYQVPLQRQLILADDTESCLQAELRAAS